MVTVTMQAVVSVSSLLHLIVLTGRPASAARSLRVSDCPPERQCTTIDDCIDSEGRTGIESEDCGYVACDRGTCEFNAFNDACTAHYVDCDGDDSKCSKGPSLLLGDDNHLEGACTGWANRECVYRWCVPEASLPASSESLSAQAASSTTTDSISFTNTTDNNTSDEEKSLLIVGCESIVALGDVGDTEILSAQAETLTAPIADEPPPDITHDASVDATVVDDCISAQDCVADPGKPPLTDCGNVRCVAGTCEFDAYEDKKPECKEHYHVFCNADHSKCTKGPVGSVGTCTLHAGSTECTYLWFVNSPAGSGLPTTATPSVSTSVPLSSSSTVAASTTSVPVAPSTTALSAVSTSIPPLVGSTTTTVPLDSTTQIAPVPGNTNCMPMRTNITSQFISGYQEMAGEVTANITTQISTTASAQTTQTTIITSATSTMSTPTSIPPGSTIMTNPPSTSANTTHAATITSTTSSSILRTGCSEPRHCIGDPGKPPLNECGTVRCNEGRCEFDAWENGKEECVKHYFTRCDQNHTKCNKGPKDSVGTCTHFGRAECTYLWFNKGSPHL